MNSLFRPTRSNNQDQIQKIHLFWIVLGLIALSFTLESLIEIFVLPENTLRWLLVIGIVDGGGLIFYFLSRAGYVYQAGLALVVVLWALITGLAFTENGVRSPTVDIAYLVIILVAGLVLDEQAGIITGVVCCLTLLGLSIAGVQGLLPANHIQRSILGTWEADVFYLVIVVGLQYLAIHSIRQALEKAHQELMERRRVEASLQKAIEERAQNQMRLELQRLLTDHLEKERLKIARDLHDGPVQDLVAVTFSLQGLIEDASDDRQRRMLQDIQASLQDQIGSLRAFAGEMRSATLIKFGLAQAIREHAEKFSNKHPEVEVQFDAPPDKKNDLSEDTRLTLFRIYQEAMNNIVRHAQASRVVIRLEKDEHSLTLQIQDNGRGFNPPEEWLELARQGHLGLVGMRERAEGIGGQFEMTSLDGQGTTVRVIVAADGLPEAARPLLQEL